MRLVISSNSDIEQARRLASWVNRPAVDHILITLPGMDTEERGRIARELKNHFNECGCTWGTVAFGLAAAWCLGTNPWGTASAPATVGYALAASVTAAIAA